MENLWRLSFLTSKGKKIVDWKITKLGYTVKQILQYGDQILNQKHKIDLYEINK